MYRKVLGITLVASTGSAAEQLMLLQTGAGRRREGGGGRKGKLRGWEEVSLY